MTNWRDMNNIEIERRFFVKNGILRKEDCPFYFEIIQGYIGTIQDIDKIVRIRKTLMYCGDKIHENSYLTIKGDKINGKGYELETRILDNVDDFFKLCPKGTILSKTRLIVPYKNRHFEVDLFHGKYENLIIAEIELDDINEDVELPSWIGQEITNNKRFSNYNLAMAQK